MATKKSTKLTKAQLMNKIDSLESAFSKFHSDGWYNLFTGMGMQQYDKRVNTKFGASDMFGRDELSELYRGDGIAKRIITIPSGDMVREWFKVNGDPEGFILQKLDSLSAKGHFSEALDWSRLYGGSVILMYIDDSKELIDPVDENNIKNIDGFQVYDRWDVSWSTIDLYNDPDNVNFGKPEFYNINNFSVGKVFRVHESRILVFDGERIGLREKLRNNGWGDSVFNSVYARLRGLQDGYAGAESIITEFIIGIMKMKNLQQLIHGTEGTTKIQQRLQLLDMSKHILNTYLLDDNEEFERVSSSGVTGMSKLIENLELALCAATGIPEIKLFEKQSKGLGGEEAGTIRLYYDDIAAMQENKLQRHLERVSRLIMLSKDYEFKGKEVDNWSIEFNKLWQPTDEEKAKTRETVAKADEIYYQMGLPGELIVLNRFGGDSYSMEINLPDEVIKMLEGVVKSKNTGEVEEEEEIE